MSTQPLNPPAHILRVALDVPLDRQFDYLANGIDAEVGQRVVVPFGRRRQVGIVLGHAAESEFDESRLKPVTQVFGDEPPLDAETLALLKFCADYYQYPYGQALLAALPTRLRQTEPAVTRKQFLYSLSEDARTAGPTLIPKRQAIQSRIYTALHEHGTLDEGALAACSPGWRKAISAMQMQGWLEAREAIAGLTPSTKRVTRRRQYR